MVTHDLHHYWHFWVSDTRPRANSMSLVFNQLKERAQQWQVTIQETQETPGSVLAFGVSRGSRVVLKITKQHGDEWRSGEVLRAFDGHGIAGS